MAPTQRPDCYGNYRFMVEIEGIVNTGFAEAIIPESVSDVIEYREGNEQLWTRKFPGLVKYGNLILKCEVTSSLVLFKWRRMVEQGNMKAARKNMAIMLIDEDGNPVARWEFSEAWPCKYKAPDMNAKGNEVAIETFEIAFENMNRTM